MIYTPMTKRAMRLMFEAHKDQVDKSGVPYVFHPWHVAESMPDEVTCTVALLHDVVEDTAMALDDIRAAGFPEEVVEALSLLTHPEGVPYLEYVARVASNPVARTVKLSDLAHNSNLSRLDEADEKTKARVEMYREARELLEGAQVFCMMPAPCPHRNL